jgi:putative ABC transport system substrate-binding protein
MTINGPRGFATYFEELKRHSYIEGKNLIVERYSALGRPERHEEIARAVVGSHPDLIVAFSNAFALQFKPLTATIPIVAATADPVAAGIVTNLAKPDGNITGVSTDAGLEVYGKRLQFLVEVARKLTNVRFLVTPTTRWLWETTALDPLRDIAARAGISIDAASLSTPINEGAYEQIFDVMRRDRVDGLIVSDAADHVTHSRVIADLAARYRVPAIYPFRSFVDVGGLLSYGIDLVDMVRRLAVVTAEVLGGAKPSDIPYYQMTKFDLVLNRTTARSLGLDFPATLLAAANEVIE